MRERMCVGTCLGRGIGTDFHLNLDIHALPKQQFNLLMRIGKDFVETFDSEEDGWKLGGYGKCDFGWVNETNFVLGIESSYMYDRTLVFVFDFKNKKDSGVIDGIAFGPYGTGIRKSFKSLAQYKRHGKRVDFINRWYDKLKEVISQK